MAATRGKQGRNGRVTLDSVIYKVLEWDMDDDSEVINMDHTESGGFQELDPYGGIERVTGTVTFLAEADLVRPIKGMHNLVLYEGAKTSPNAIAFKAFLSGFKHTNRVKTTDPITWQAKFESSGVIARGTDTVPDPWIP